MTSEFGGEDLFRRLLPNSWKWATYAAAREAARRTDAESRRQAHDPDSIISLFSLGAAIDRRLDERLADLVRSGQPPSSAFPQLAAWLGKPFDRDEFADWVRGHGEPTVTQAPVGRCLRGAPPDDVGEAAGALVAGLAPVGPRYPLPHFKRAT